MIGRPFQSRDDLRVNPGDRFGRLTVVHEVGTRHKGHVAVLCRCDCGRETTPTRSSLRAGKTRTCGCRQGVIDRVVHDIEGKRFGALVAVRKNRKIPGGQTWDCLCDCGAMRLDVTAARLNGGRVTRCESCVYKDGSEYIEGRKKLFNRYLAEFSEEFSGKKFASRTVIGHDPRFKGGGRWLVLCGDCGSTHSVLPAVIRDEKPCGCSNWSRGEIGSRFGSWRITGNWTACEVRDGDLFPHLPASRRKQALCEITCDCGYKRLSHPSVFKEKGQRPRCCRGCYLWRKSRGVANSAVVPKRGRIVRLYRAGLALDTIIKQRPQKSQRRRPEAVV